MRSACPTAMTTSRLTSRSFVTRSSSFDLASGRITYRSKSKLTVDAVVTFSGFGAGFGGGGGGGGKGLGAGAGGGGGAGSGVAAQPANASRTIADSAMLSLLFMLSSRRLRLEPRLKQLRYARLKLLFLLLTYSATEEHDCSSCDFRIPRVFFPGPGVPPRPTHAIRARVLPSTPDARPGHSTGQARARRRRPRTGRRICPARGTRSRLPGRARGRRAASRRRGPDAPASPRRRCPPPLREARRCAFPGTGPGGCCSPRRRCRDRR